MRISESKCLRMCVIIYIHVYVMIQRNYSYSFYIMLLVTHRPLLTGSADVQSVMCSPLCPSDSPSQIKFCFNFVLVSGMFKWRGTLRLGSQRRA